MLLCFSYQRYDESKQNSVSEFSKGIFSLWTKLTYMCVVNSFWVFIGIKVLDLNTDKIMKQLLVLVIPN